MTDNGQFIPMTCPNCGGKLMISEKQEKVICSYCGNSFLLPKNTNSTSESIENHLKLAKIAQGMEKFDEALDHCDKVLELDADNYLAWYGKALAYGWRDPKDYNHYRDAHDYFLKSIDNAPEKEKPLLQQNAAFEIYSMCNQKYAEIISNYNDFQIYYDKLKSSTNQFIFKRYSYETFSISDGFFPLYNSFR